MIRLASASSGIGRYCCKSGKSNCRKNLAKVDIEASPLLHRLSVPLRGSEIDLGSVDMVLTSSRAKRISGSKNFCSTSQKDFCNNIGPFRTFWDVRFESAKRRVADMSQAALASLDFMSTHPRSRASAAAGGSLCAICTASPPTKPPTLRSSALVNRVGKLQPHSASPDDPRANACQHFDEVLYTTSILQYLPVAILEKCLLTASA